MKFSDFLSGGLAGGGLGSAFGPVGIGVGSVLGGIGGLLSRPKSSKIRQASTLSPQQEQTLNPFYQGLGDANQGGLEQLMQLLNYQPQGQQEMEQPLFEQFQQQVIPGILERFLGSGNSKGSGGLNQAIGQGLRGLGGDIASMRAQQQQGAAGIRQQAIQQLLQFNQMLNNPSFRMPYMKQGQQGLASQIAQPAANVAGSYFSNLLNR